MIDQRVAEQGVAQRVGLSFAGVRPYVYQAVLEDPVFGTFRVSALTRRACKRKYGDLCGRLYLDQ